jgi:carboxyl-terminal processing protease
MSTPTDRNQRETTRAGAWRTYIGFIVAAAALPVGIALRDMRDVGSANPTKTALADRNLVASMQPVAIPEADYFRDVSALLKHEYVEPVTDDQKLASGAVRGMILSLNDAGSLFYDKNEFRTLLNQREGKFEGIGAQFALVERGEINRSADQSLGGQPPESAEESLMTRIRIPRLAVVALTPDGSAAKAGVKVGDLVYEIDQHWVANTDLLVKFQRAQQDYDKKKITLSQLNTVRKEVREKTERALMPMKASNKLTQGSSGTVRVVWERSGQKRETLLAKSLTNLTGNGAVTNGVATLRFSTGADETLKKALAGKVSALDLRQSVDGDYATMRKCLALVTPSGTYGAITSERASKPTPVVVKSSVAKPPKLKLLVDSSTRGASLIFAKVLQKSGVAVLVGRPGEDVAVRTTVALPDGTGYTLVTGLYDANPKGKAIALNTENSEGLN